MKIDVTNPLLDLDDRPIVLDSTESATPGPLTARRAIINALMLADPKLDGTEKLGRYLLAALINKKDEVDLTNEQVTLIKAEVARCYGPLVVGRIYELVDPACVRLDE